MIASVLGIIYHHSLVTTNQAPKKCWVGRLFSFWDDVFSGAKFVFCSVIRPKIFWRCGIGVSVRFCIQHSSCFPNFHPTILGFSPPTTKFLAPSTLFKPTNAMITQERNMPMAPEINKHRRPQRSAKHKAWKLIENKLHDPVSPT